MEGKIILEEHFTTELNNRFWDAEGEQSRNGKGYSEHVSDSLLAPETALLQMDRAGIEHCVLSLTSPGVQSLIDPEEATELARSSNDYAHAVVDKYPERFSAFAAVAMQDTRAAAGELQRAVQQLGFKGALINGYTNLASNQVRYLDEKPVWDFWECVSSLNVPVYLHPVSRFHHRPLHLPVIRSLSARPGVSATKPPATPFALSSAACLIISPIFR